MVLSLATYVNSQELSHTSTRHFAIKLGLSRETFRVSQYATLPYRVNEETCNRTHARRTRVICDYGRWRVLPVREEARPVSKERLDGTEAPRDRSYRTAEHVFSGILLS